MTASTPSLDLDLCVREAHARWPQVALDAAAFGAHLLAIGSAAPAYPLDAYVAAACAAGDAAALRVIDEEWISGIADVVRRVDPSSVFANEISQQLRIRLFVRETDAPPRIARYSGEVPLSAWIRVIALRLAFNAKRSSKAENQVGIENADDVARLADEDPAIDVLRAQYREPFARAFEEALATLSKQDCTILRLHYVDGVNIDGIGTIFGVHRATIARWLVRIRGEALEKARALLAAHVGAELDEADSVIGALAGEIDLTLSRVLGRSNQK